jgi:hypothetical protein
MKITHHLFGGLFFYTYICTLIKNKNIMSENFTVSSLAERIKADNERFKKSTKAEKRVIIAQDCLDRIRLSQIIPKFGSFCSLKVRKDESTSLKAVLDTEDQPICSSCAKGSLFMSYLGRVNQFTVYDLEYNSGNSAYDDSHLKLLEIFSKKQLSLIEFFFEGEQYVYKAFKFDKHIIEAYRERIIGGYDTRTLEGANLMLIELCNNIIKNKGTFKLPKK